MSWDRKSNRAGKLVDLAHSYWEDGALGSAARTLRTAADLLDQAQQERNDALNSAIENAGDKA